MNSASDLPARQGSVREHNLALLINMLAVYGPTSRARLSAITGLTKSTISTIVDALIAGGLVHEIGPGENPGALGRPGSRVALAGTGPVGIGIDIDVDHVLVATVDLTGTVRHFDVIPGNHRGSQVGTVLTRAAMALRRALEGARLEGSPVAGVTVALPGLVETATGRLRYAPNLDWRDLDVANELRDQSDGALPSELPVYVDNQANLSALAELWRCGHLDSDGLPLTSFLHVSSTIGIGAGLVLDGAVYRGRRGFSGELGHVGVAVGPLPRALAHRLPSTCSCGRHDCLERYAGLTSMLLGAGLDPATDGLAELEAAARSGRRNVSDVLTTAGVATGRAIAGALNMLDVDTVVLGGSLARLAEWTLPAVRAELDALVVTAQLHPVQALSGSLGAEAAALGGAQAVVQAVLADPAAYLAP